MKGVFLLKTFWGGRLKLDTIINTNFSVNRRALGSSIELTEINYWCPYIYIRLQVQKVENLGNIQTTYKTILLFLTEI
jgi:hypothetical protein